MKIVAEITDPLSPVTVKLAVCCEKECAAWAFAQRTRDNPVRDGLWLCLGQGPDVAALREHAEFIAKDLGSPDDDCPPSELIDRGVALFGMPLDHLCASEAKAREQMVAWTAQPGWIHRMPAEWLWDVRSHVFGEELTRVVRAVGALDGYYVNEYPVRREDLGGVQ